MQYSNTCNLWNGLHQLSFPHLADPLRFFRRSSCYCLFNFLSVAPPQPLRDSTPLPTLASPFLSVRHLASHLPYCLYVCLYVCCPSVCLSAWLSVYFFSVQSFGSVCLHVSLSFCFSFDLSACLSSFFFQSAFLSVWPVIYRSAVCKVNYKATDLQLYFGVKFKKTTNRVFPGLRAGAKIRLTQSDLDLLKLTYESSLRQFEGYPRLLRLVSPFLRFSGHERSIQKFVQVPLPRWEIVKSVLRFFVTMLWLTRPLVL